VTGSSRTLDSVWRPLTGWVCGMAVAWTFLICPILTWLFWLFPEYREVMETAPKMDSAGELIALLMGMLGLGGMRSYDKKWGVDQGQAEGRG